MDCCGLIYLIGALIICALFVAVLIVKLTSGDTYSALRRYKQEKEYVDPSDGMLKQFPFLCEKAEVQLSVIVPSYNEEERLPVMLDETVDYLEKRKSSDPSFSYEIIVVDDGSKDKTSKVAMEFAKSHDNVDIRVLKLFKNRGKGGAVRMGVFSCRGDFILMVDADGATRFSDLDQVEKSLLSLEGGKEGMAISIGSRAHLQNEAIAQRSFFRNILMFGFHFLVDLLCVKGIKDTQCGFKLFTRKAAFKVFSSLHVERWAFDVELLYIAQQVGIPITEVAVNWQEMDGSKMIPLFSWLQMGKDLLLIRVRYILGAWKMISGSLPEHVEI